MSYRWLCSGGGSHICICAQSFDAKATRCPSLNCRTCVITCHIKSVRASSHKNKEIQKKKEKIIQCLAICKDVCVYIYIYIYVNIRICIYIYNIHTCPMPRGLKEYERHELPAWCYHYDTIPAQPMLLLLLLVLLLLLKSVS